MTRDDTVQLLVKASAQLSDKLDTLAFSRPAVYVYNPLDYAREAYFRYLEKYAAPPVKVLFLGMNPGPWGMGQTGIPFGEINAVKSWLKLHAEIGTPAREHPSRPVVGFSCTRSEVSGRRVWGLMQERFSSAEAFFADHFVANYCPLLFFDENGKNITPDKLKKTDRENLYSLCDGYLAETIDLLQPSFLVGIGKFALTRFESVYHSNIGSWPGIKQVLSVLHPSPANPKANKGWSAQTVNTLTEAGIWDADG